MFALKLEFGLRRDIIVVERDYRSWEVCKRWGIMRGS